ncbi:MAG: hypothetical protein ABIS67_06270 [Candidatus Eisenbacteria bacterium]
MRPYFTRVAVLGACAALFALTCWIALVVARGDAWAAPGDHKFINLRGRVADASGSPLGDVRVEAAGTREGIALTNSEGRFNLTIDLGSLQEMQRNPVSFSVKAWRAGLRIRVAGGARELGLELSLGNEGGVPVLQARSNFGIIADAVLDALAPVGVRTAVIQVRFVGEPGTEPDSTVTLSDAPRSVRIEEPWLASAVRSSPAPARVEPAPAPAPATAAPTMVSGRVDPPPAPPVTRATPGRVKRATERRKEDAERVGKEPRPPVRNPASAPPMRLTHADTLRLARAAEQRAAIATAQAQRDSLWRGNRVQALARKAVVDSLRAVRDSAEDSARRVRYGLSPRPPAQAVAVKPAPRPPDLTKEQAQEAKRAARDEKRAAKLRAEDEREARKLAEKQRKQAAREATPTTAMRQADPPGSEQEATPLQAAVPARGQRSSGEGRESQKPSNQWPARPDSLLFSPTVGSAPATSGLRRVAQRPDAATATNSDAAPRGRVKADSCGCVVRGTVEMEFHRLLTSPMRVEVSIREMPAFRDTIELFMGSPRAFELTHVPCGRWSLAVRPFSERPFGITTPEEVGPFSCRQRLLRQVRIVIAPMRSSH